MLKTGLGLFLAAALSWPLAGGEAIDPGHPLPPEESLKKLHVHPNFEAEIVAAEPLTMDPTAIDWDSAGRLWVVEMADYPSGMDGKGKPGGRVRILEDADGDGKFEKSTLFLDNLGMPNGLLCWRNGVLITAAPDILYAEDTNGDGKADIVNKLYSGFRQGNPQLRVNSLRWGTDGWIYCANGWSEGDVTSAKTGVQVHLGRRDLRIRPDEGALDLQSGITEFGRDTDDWGNWYGCDNSNPLWHFVLQDHYTRRNPYIAPPESRLQLATPPNPKVFTRAELQKRYHSFEQSGRFTSACSTMIYRDELLFPRGELMHNFVCEPVHNVVQHWVLKDHGVTFSASRADDEKDFDFLASEDSWFKPVMVRTGPDGALWVCDMYRFIVEHPEFLPPIGREELGPFFRHGENQGRIYRVFPKGKRPAAFKGLDKLSPEELAGTLSSSNGWLRDKAQQMLYWKRDTAATAAAPVLEKLYRESAAPQTRLHALCTLDLLGALKPELLVHGLADAHPGVRVHALRLSESRAAAAPQLIEAALKLSDDPHAKVRLQLACSLGEWDDSRAGAALAKVLLKDADNMYIVASGLSSAGRHLLTLVDALHGNQTPAGRNLSGSLLAMSFANRDAMAKLLQPLLTAADGKFSGQQYRAFGSWLQATRRNNTSIEKLAGEKADGLGAQLKQAGAILSAAQTLAQDGQAPAAERIAALSVLGLEPAAHAADLKLLTSLLTPQTVSDVQAAAVAAISRTQDAQVPELLLAGWKGHLPNIRVAIADQLIGREAWAMALLARIESGKIAPLEIDATRRERLLKHGSKTVKALAQKVLTSVTNEDRQKVIQDYQSALKLAGDAKRGAVVFAKPGLCATCHRIKDVGNEIGPNLRSLTDKNPPSLLTAILDPNQSVELKYMSYVVALNSGQRLEGMLTTETGNSITLKGSDAKEHIILRSDIKALNSTNRSLMPDGLEASITPQEMADLIEFLRAND